MTGIDPSTKTQQTAAYRKHLAGLQEETESSVITVEDSLSIINKTFRQKINKEIGELNNSINQIDPANTDRALHHHQQLRYSSQGHMRHSPGKTI